MTHEEAPDIDDQTYATQALWVKKIALKLGTTVYTVTLKMKPI